MKRVILLGVVLLGMATSCQKECTCVQTTTEYVNGSPTVLSSITMQGDDEICKLDGEVVEWSTSGTPDVIVTFRETNCK